MAQQSPGNEQSFQVASYKQELECIQVKMAIRDLFYIIKTIIYKMFNVAANC